MGDVDGKTRKAVVAHPNWENFIFVICNSVSERAWLETNGDLFDNPKDAKEWVCKKLRESAVRISEGWLEDDENAPCTFFPRPSFSFHAPRVEKDPRTGDPVVVTREFPPSVVMGNANVDEIWEDLITRVNRRREKQGRPQRPVTRQLGAVGDAAAAPGRARMPRYHLPDRFFAVIFYPEFIDAYQQPISSLSPKDYNFAREHFPGNCAESLLCRMSPRQQIFESWPAAIKWANDQMRKLAIKQAKQDAKGVLPRLPRPEIVFHNIMGAGSKSQGQYPNVTQLDRNHDVNWGEINEVYRLFHIHYDNEMAAEQRKRQRKQKQLGAVGNVAAAVYGAPNPRHEWEETEGVVKALPRRKSPDVERQTLEFLDMVFPSAIQPKGTLPASGSSTKTFPFHFPVPPGVPVEVWANGKRFSPVAIVHLKLFTTGGGKSRLDRLVSPFAAMVAREPMFPVESMEEAHKLMAQCAMESRPGWVQEGCVPHEMAGGAIWELPHYILRRALDGDGRDAESAHIIGSTAYDHQAKMKIFASAEVRIGESGKVALLKKFGSPGAAEYAAKQLGAVGDVSDVAPPPFQRVIEFRAEVFATRPGTDAPAWCPLWAEPDDGIKRITGSASSSDIRNLQDEAEDSAANAAEKLGKGTPWRVIAKVERIIAEEPTRQCGAVGDVAPAAPRDAVPAQTRRRAFFLAAQPDLPIQPKRRTPMSLMRKINHICAVIRALWRPEIGRKIAMRSAAWDAAGLALLGAILYLLAPVIGEDAAFFAFISAVLALVALDIFIARRIWRNRGED